MRFFRFGLFIYDFCLKVFLSVPEVSVPFCECKPTILIYIVFFSFQSSSTLLSDCSLGEAQVESLLSVGDEQGRIGLSFLQSQAASPGLYSLLRCRAGDLTKVQRPPLSLVQLIQYCPLIGPAHTILCSHWSRSAEW